MFKTKERKQAMKKIYQNPEIKIVKVQTAQIMAGSPGYGGNTIETSGNLSRENGGSLWDDDEEDY